MEYQNIINPSDATSNQPYKFRTKTWDEVNDEYSLCDYGDYLLKEL